MFVNDLLKEDGQGVGGTKVSILPLIGYALYLHVFVSLTFRCMSADVIFKRMHGTSFKPV